MGEGDVRERWCLAMADDLAILARFHRQECASEDLRWLKESRFVNGLLLDRERKEVQEQLQKFAAAVSDAVESSSSADELDADFAAAYLTKAFGVAPFESAFLDEEGLVRQEPSFRVREFYRRHGFESADWKNLPDDHLALELEFLSFLLGRVAQASLAASEAMDFLDGHVLRWAGQFLGALSDRCRTAFYSSLAALTRGILDEVRAGLLQQQTPFAP